MPSCHLLQAGPPDLPPNTVSGRPFACQKQIVRGIEKGVAGVFGRFARFPAAREAPLPDGSVRVVLRDVRFGYLSPDVDPFTYVVRYDTQGRLLGAGFPSGRWTRPEAGTGGAP